MADTQIPYYRPVGRPRYSSFSAGNLGGGAVDYSPLSRALQDVVQLWGSQVEDSRQTKLRSSTATASTELRRYAFSVSDPSSPDYVADPAARPDAFLKGKETIQQKWLKHLDDEGIGGHDAFVQSFDESSLGEEFDLRKASSIALNQQQEANLISTLDQTTRLAGEGTPEQEQQWRDFGVKSIEQAVRAGTISPVEGVKQELRFRDDVIGTRVRRDLGADPHQTEQQLLGGGYEDLGPEQRQIWLARASAAAEREENKRIAAENRSRIEGERFERKHADALSKEGDHLLASGKLTPEWIERNRDGLDSVDYRHFYNELETDTTTVKDNPEVYADLRLRAGRGELTRAEARTAYTSQQITRDSFDRLVNLNEDSDPTTTRAWIKNGESYIGTALKPSDLNPTPGAPQSLALALDEWRSWAAAHQDAAPEEARKVYQGIVEHRSLTDFGEILSDMQQGQPDLAPVQTPADLDRAEDALVEEFLAKHGGDEAAMAADQEFVRRSADLARLRTAAGPALAAKPAGGASLGPR